MTDIARLPRPAPTSNAAVRPEAFTADGDDKAAIRQAEQRAEAFEHTVAPLVDDARAQLTDAATALGTPNLPTLSARELQSQQAALAKQTPTLNQTVSNAQATIAKTDAARAKLDTEAAAAQKVVDQYSHRVLDGAGGVIDNLEQMIARNPKDPDLKGMKERLADAKSDLSLLQNAQAVVANADDQRPRLDATRAKAQAELAKAQAQLKGNDTSSNLLGKQVTYANAKTSYDGLSTQLGQVRTAESTLRAQETALNARDQSAISNALTVTSSAQDANDQSAMIASNGTLPIYEKAVAIDKAVSEGKLKAKNVDLDRLAQVKNTFHDQIDKATTQRESTATAVVQQFQNPAFQKALSRMDDASRADVIGKMLKSIDNSQAGTDFLKQNLQPLLDGSKGPSNNPLAPLFDGSSPKAALAVVQSSAGFLARGNLVDPAMQKALGIDKEQLAVVQQAVGLVNIGKVKDAESLLTSKGLGKLAGDFAKTAGAYTLLGTAGAIAAMSQSPEMMKVLEGGSKGLSAVSMASMVAKSLPQMERYQTLIGGAGATASKINAPIQVFTNAYEIFKTGGTVDRGDVGGTVGKYIAMSGATIATTGLVLDGSVIGAVPGLTLNVIGGAIGAIGFGIDLVWGDNDTEKWLKANAPEYLKF